MKKLLAIVLSSLMMLSIMVGCGSKGADAPNESAPAPSAEAKEEAAAPSASTEAAPEAKVEAPAEAKNDAKATLTLAIYDPMMVDVYPKLDLQGRFQELYPNVDIEIETFKNDSEYWDAMKIRASANELPDLMFNKPFTLVQFKDYMLDLSDTQAAKSNAVASSYAVDGKVLGIPQFMTTEYVYYWEDMFTEAGVTVPTTWNAFIETAEKLQAFYGAKDPDFMAIALGAKDEWPNYPFVEFMPALQNGDGFNWNSMAKMDAPFADGTNMNKAYSKIYELYSKPVFGKDPNGVGYDQVASMFAQKKAAIIVAGSWCLDTIKKGTDDVSKLKSFYLPVRDSESDPFRRIAQGDSMLGITTSCKNPDIAKAFIEFYFGDKWYPDFIAAVPSDGTVDAYKKAKDPIFQAADDAQPAEKELVMYDGGGADFQALVNETKFDYKKLGSQMFIKDFDLKKTFAELDASWTAARAKLGIK